MQRPQAQYYAQRTQTWVATRMMLLTPQRKNPPRAVEDDRLQLQWKHGALWQQLKLEHALLMTMTTMRAMLTMMLTMV